MKSLIMRLFRAGPYRGFVPALAAMILVAALGGAVPLLGVLGYETAVATALVLFLAAASWGLAVPDELRRPGLGPFRTPTGLPFAEAAAALGLRLRGGLVLAAVPVLGCLLRQGLGQGCRVHPGLPLYLAVVLPALLLGLGVGFAAGALLPGRRWTARLAVLAFLLLAAGWTFAEAWLGPRIVPHNLILGQVSLGGYNGYDASLAPPVTLVRQRLFTTLLAVLTAGAGAVVLSRRALRSPVETEDEAKLRGALLRDRRHALLLVGGTGLALAGFLFAPGASGLSPGNARLEAALSETVSGGEHVRVHHAPDGLAAAAAERIAVTAQWWTEGLSQRLGVQPARIDLWLYDSDAQQADLTGARGFLFAQPWRSALHVRVRRGAAPSLDHELVHVIAGAFGPPPFAASWQPGLTEGLATALQHRMDLDPQAHAVAAAALARGHLPERFLGPLEFGASGMLRSYRAAGSFCGYLLMTRGPEPMRRAYRTGDLEEAYGRTEEELVAAWRRFLRTVPFDEEADRRAVRLYDPTRNPPFFATACPRVGSLRWEEKLLERARLHLRAGREGEAARLGLEHGARRPEARLGALLWAGRVWSAADDPRGRVLLERVAEEEDAAGTRALRALFLQALEDGRTARARDLLARLAERGERVEEAELLQASPAPSRRQDPYPRGTSKPTAPELAWLLLPAGGERDGLSLPERREAVERWVALGRRGRRAQDLLEDLVARELRAGRLAEAREHARLLLALDLPDERRGRARELADLTSTLVSVLGGGREKGEGSPAPRAAFSGEGSAITRVLAPCPDLPCPSP